MEMTRDHNCFDYDFSNFSIELELLDLSFSLEPYGPAEDDYSPLYVAEDNTPNYYSPSRAPSNRSPANFGMRRKPVPMFLRM